MAFKTPTAETEDLYIKSINNTVDQYKAFLRALGADTLELPNRDLDSGNLTKAAEYTLTDETYAKLVTQLSDRQFDQTSAALRSNILDFYSDLSLPIETKKDEGHWRGVLIALEQLKLVAPIPSVAVSPETVPVESIAPKATHVLVIGFVGGFIKHDNLVHSEVQLAARLRKEYPAGVQVETFESYHGDKARQSVLTFLDLNHDQTLTPQEKRDARIIIYGHSWGGSEAINLARRLDKDGIPVLLTIQVDSVAKIHEDDGIIPRNVVQAANFYQTNGRLHGREKIRAADPTRTNILGNFRFDYAQSTYNCGEYPWYDRVFSKAHTQIECDPRVWKQVEKLIRTELHPE
jgi:hypothetical protein